MENENNVSIVTNERDYTKAVTGGSFNVFKAVKISKFNILKRRAAKAAKKAEKLQKQSEAYAAERDATKENVDNNFLFNVFNNKSKEKQQESNKYVEKAIIANTNAALVEADLKVLYQNKASKPIRLRQGIKNIASKWNNWLKSKIVKSKAVDVPVNDDIEITKIDEYAKIKNISFKITDKELLDKTGGVVQGMSGSPIMQNGKIIGAVTHVIIDNPTTGYGLFITTMLEEGEK